MSASQDFRDFEESFFGSRGYGWELNVPALLRLKGNERVNAESLLLDALRRGDREAAYGLGEMRSTSAIADLKTKLECADTRLVVQSALALWKIERFPKAADAIAGCLKRTSPADPVDDEEIDGDLLEFEHVDAVVALGAIPTPESAAALVNALDHPRELVRANAADALGRVCGQSRDLAPLQTAVMSENPDESQAAKQKILSLIDTHNVRDFGNGEYEINFDWMAHEYLVYREGAVQFYFHPDYAQEPVVVPTGDYLSGILGKPRSFDPDERERIVPRLEEFLRRERTQFRVSHLKHRPEPDELTPSLGGKIRFKTLAAQIQEPDDEEVIIPRWQLALILSLGLGLGGGVGWAVGRFAVLMLDFRPVTAWICVGLGGMIGAVLAWLVRARG